MSDNERTEAFINGYRSIYRSHFRELPSEERTQMELREMWYGLHDITTEHLEDVIQEHLNTKTAFPTRASLLEVWQQYKKDNKISTRTPLAEA